MLLSVGYSTCHWCHVMEEESFDDVEIAGFINEHYVIVKVDRGERTDVDAACAAQPERIIDSANRLSQAVRESLAPDTASKQLPDARILETAAE